MKIKLSFVLLLTVLIIVGGVFLFKNPVEKNSTGAPKESKLRAPRTILDPFDTVSGARTGLDPIRDGLRFSNTTGWEKRYFDITKLESWFVPDWRTKITLPPPPANTSIRTAKELALLKNYQETLRTPERVKNILDEVNATTTKFGDFMVTDYLDETKFPATAAALGPALKDINTLVFKMKQKYDRARPSVLDSSIIPVVTVPGHPAYPSGHSTQMHFVAYVLSELMPDRAAEFENRADEIAMDREIAGLHYPSDTKAGQMLAREYMDILLGDTTFQTRLDLARREWRQK